MLTVPILVYYSIVYQSCYTISDTLLFFFNLFVNALRVSGILQSDYDMFNNYPLCFQNGFCYFHVLLLQIAHSFFFFCRVRRTFALEITFLYQGNPKQVQFNLFQLYRILFTYGNHIFSLSLKCLVDGSHYRTINCVFILRFFFFPEEYSYFV